MVTALPPSTEALLGFLGPSTVHGVGGHHPLGSSARKYFSASGLVLGSQASE